MTSVLRTYYTWKVVKEPDVSYNIILMGLWTLAEVATGIIISCLPVLPRFFRHVGPILYRAFSLGSKSSSSSGSASTGRNARPCLTSPTVSMARTPRTLNNSRISKAHVKGEYTEMEEYDATISQATATHQLRPGPIKSNRELESGGYGFPLRDTFYEETRLDTSF